MPKGSLAYSTAACDVMVLFRRNQFKLLKGGGEGELEGPMAEDAGAFAATESTQRGTPTPLVSPTSAKKQRIPGLNRGTIKLSEDFNDPLPDEFWLGIE